MTDRVRDAHGDAEGPSENFLAATQTVLAWRRMALQVGLGAVVAARLLTSRFGPAVFIVAVVGVVAAIAVHASASSAYAHATKSRGGHLTGPAKARVADPRVRLSIVAAFALAVALAALVWMGAQW